MATAKKATRRVPPKPSSAKDMDGYFAKAPADQRAALLRLRKAIRAAAPKATETMRYGMAGYMYKGKPLLHVAYWKSHVALYGSFEAHAAALNAYDQSGRGTYRFPVDEPLPYALVTKIVKSRVAEIDRGR